MHYTCSKGAFRIQLCSLYECTNFQHGHPKVHLRPFPTTLCSLHYIMVSNCSCSLPWTAMWGVTEQAARMKKMQEDEKRKKAEFRKKVWVCKWIFQGVPQGVNCLLTEWSCCCCLDQMEKDVSDFIQDSSLQKKKYEPMGKIERSILWVKHFSLFIIIVCKVPILLELTVFFLPPRLSGTTWPRWPVWPPSHSGRTKKADMWCSLKR